MRCPLLRRSNAGAMVYPSTDFVGVNQPRHGKTNTIHKFDDLKYKLMLMIIILIESIRLN